MKKITRYQAQSLFFVFFVLSFFLLVYFVENFDSQKAIYVGRIAYVPFVLVFGNIGMHIDVMLESTENQKI